MTKEIVRPAALPVQALLGVACLPPLPLLLLPLLPLLPLFLKELETTRKAHLSLFHSLIFGITQLDSRRGK